MTEDQIEEAAASAMVSVGASAMLHGTGYRLEKFQDELEQAVEHIKNQTKVAV